MHYPPAINCGVYKRMLQSDKWKKNKIVLPTSLQDPLDVANQMRCKRSSYRQLVDTYHENLAIRNENIAYLPCKEMPYGFFLSEKTPYPYNSKQRLPRSSSGSDFPVIDLNDMSSEYSSSSEGQYDESGITGTLKKNGMNSDTDIQ